MLRQQIQNIPMEIMRTVVAIAETGSMSKAADRLNLSQPAISAQIKRLQGLIGGELFTRTANGTALTELGKLALQQARRIIDANDQILRLGGSDRSSVRRLGISQLLAQRLFDEFSRENLSGVFLFAEHSSEIRRGLLEGFIDVACLFLLEGFGQELEDRIVGEFQFETNWVKARDFVARPGAPIPIITLPEDNWMIGPLDRSGIAYRIVLRSSDSSVRTSAVRAGLGLSAMPGALAAPDIVRSRDYYLPKLPPSRAVVCVREGLDDSDVKQLAKRLSVLLANLNIDQNPPRDATSRG
ncbi:LysR family transcriptional regulator [Bradyrhizobium sp. WYCCWR 13022]|uniref:LysR family transcriptional regulator n=1 Tax=unclassified Bradyrhizobium TaxID=2631580 RepID=UPI00263ADD59|nr:LysR family transcriptional regulator [Bradyrhizobium sp. WYCCWR 13022]MDN4987345.1 LysR family transcriptional regulator [Bradyrhizobium sp. WYCCWR 13022]